MPRIRRAGVRRRIRSLRPATPPAPQLVPELVAGATAGSTTGTSTVVTLPPYQAGDVLTLLVSSNQAPVLGFSAGVASFTVLANASGRLQALRIVPVPGATQVTLTATVSAVLTWWCAAWRNVDPAATVPAAAASLGGNTTAAVEAPAIDLGFLATGREVYIRAAGVNSTATWGASPSAVYSTTTGNGALSVRSGRVPADALTSAPATPFDRGNAGTARTESALGFVLQPAQSPARNRLTNGSFESGGNVATGWEIEGTAPRLPTCSRVTAPGVVDGAYAQRFQFTGQAGDSGNVAIYQAPVHAVPGETLHASIYLSGTLTNAYAIFGIEGFAPGNIYISEEDTTMTVLTATPIRYDVEYVCPPGCEYVAVYFQVPALDPAAVVDVYLDRAVLL